MERLAYRRHLKKAKVFHSISLAGLVGCSCTQFARNKSVDEIENYLKTVSFAKLLGRMF